jgi:hypothetical protein
VPLNRPFINSSLRAEGLPPWGTADKEAALMRPLEEQELVSQVPV